MKLRRGSLHVQKSVSASDIDIRDISSSPAQNILAHNKDRVQERMK